MCHRTNKHLPPKKETVKWSLFLDFTLLFLGGYLQWLAMTSTSQDLKEYYTLCQSLVRDDDAIPKNLQTTKSLSPWRVTRHFFCGFLPPKIKTHGKNGNFFGTMKNDRNLNSPFQWIGLKWCELKKPYKHYAFAVSMEHRRVKHEILGQFMSQILLKKHAWYFGVRHFFPTNQFYLDLG